MSDSGRPMSDLGLVDGLTDRFRNSLTCVQDVDKGLDINKPDFRELDLGSPVSPLRIRPSGLATTTTTTTSSSSSSSGSVSARNSSHLGPKKSDSSHSGELSGSVESSPTARGKKPGHARSYSGGNHSLVYSGGGGGGSAVNSPPPNALPTGNICPSGKVVKTGMASKSSKSDVLRSGTGYYGHGSIMRGGTGPKSIGADGGAVSNPRKTERGLLSSDPEELKILGNENYKKGQFLEALSLYDKAIAICPGNAACHCNRAAALIGLKRLSEAVTECEEAIKLDPSYVRAHHRLGSLLLSLGQVERAKIHICFPGHQPDQVELHKLQAVEKHIGKCTDLRRARDWTGTLREVDAAISSGAASSPQLFACRAEALLKLHQVEDAESSLSNTRKPDPSIASSKSKIFGMLSEAYYFFVQAQIDLAVGRFENALGAVERAGNIEPGNSDVSVLLNNVRFVVRARGRGNDLFKSERFTEACAAYGEGLRRDSSNSVLYCNRAACWFKLGQWEKSVEDCNRALSFQPNYTKALLRRAASNTKLERWAETVRDYEVLRKQLPYDNEVAESLFHAQVSLKKSRGEDVHNMKFGGEVELVSGLEQFRAAISSPCASVVHFKAASNLQCKQIAPFLDTLTAKYPCVNFLKVDVEESPAIAAAENVRIIPTFKMYKKGSRVKEMICPSQEVLESSVRHYSI